MKTNVTNETLNPAAPAPLEAPEGEAGKAETKPAKATYPKSIPLPSGGFAVIKRKGKGRDLPKAQARAGEPDKLAFALIAMLCTVNGVELTVEQVDHLELEDVLALVAEVMPAETKTEPGKLPSGKAYETRKGKGADLIKAQRMAKEPNAVSLGLVAALAKVDGKALVIEDVEGMDLDDVFVLVNEVMPAGKSSSPDET